MAAAAPPDSRPAAHGPSRHGITSALGGCAGSTLAALLAVVVTAAVVGTALRGCSDELGRATAPPVGVTVGAQGELILAVPECAPPATAVSLYPLAGAELLWRVQAEDPTEVSLVVVGSQPQGFEVIRPLEVQDMPAPDVRLRLAISFDRSATGADGDEADGGDGSGATETVLVSSEVVFRVEDLQPGLIWVGDENVDADAFDARACPEPS